MKYLCLACGDEAAWNDLTEEQQQALAAKCRTHDEKLAADERVETYVGLGAGGRLIRRQDGERVVTDGPFIESKEIGGVFVVEADDLDEATELASLHPAAQLGEDLGWYVVVRPIRVPDHVDRTGAGEGAGEGAVARTEAGTA